MSTCLNSYYLEQMGIDRWIRRSPPPAKVMLIVDAMTIEMVAGIPWVKGKEGRLLHQMLKSISLTQERIVLVSTNALESTLLPAINASGIVIFGDVQSFDFQTYRVPVIHLPSLTTLLHSPMLKKSVYRQLLPLQLGLS